MASSAASGATLGVLASALAAILGYLGVRAKNRTDGAGTLVDAGIALAAFEAGQRHAVETKLADALTRIAELEADVAECKRDRTVLIELADAAGIRLPTED